MIPIEIQPSVTDPLIVAVVSVFLTLIVGAIIGLVTALLARKGEHTKWLRERRYDAYVAFMVDMNTLSDLISTKPTATNARKLLDRITDYTETASAAFEAVSLLGPRKVNNAGQKWLWAITDYLKTKSEPAAAAVAEARWQFLVVAGAVLSSKNVTTERTIRPGMLPAEISAADLVGDSTN